MGDSLPTSVEIRLMVDFASGEAPAAWLHGWDLCEYHWVIMMVNNHRCNITIIIDY